MKKNNSQVVIKMTVITMRPDTATTTKTKKSNLGSLNMPSTESSKKTSEHQEPWLFEYAINKQNKQTSATATATITMEFCQAST